MHNIRSDNICVNKSKDPKSNSTVNNNKIQQTRYPQSNTFVHNVNNFINLTEHSTLPGSTSEAFKSRRDIDERNPIVDKQIKEEHKKPDFSKEQDITKNLMLLDLFYNRFKNEDQKNSEILKRVKKHFEKNLAKLLARTFVNNILKNINSENLFKKILNDFMKKKKETPIKEGTHFSDLEKESGKDNKSLNKTNLCPHPDKPHYAKVKIYLIFYKK
jgi:hypothetical protein